MNIVILIGRLTADPELRYTADEKSSTVCSFSVAVNRPTKSNETDFIRCVSFGKTAENISKYFQKGNRIAVMGQLRVNNYENKDGEKRTSVDVMVKSFEFLENKKNENEQNENKSRKYIPDGELYDDEDLPF